MGFSRGFNNLGYRHNESYQTGTRKIFVSVQITGKLCYCRAGGNKGDKTGVIQGRTGWKEGTVLVQDG